MRQHIRPFGPWNPAFWMLPRGEQLQIRRRLEDIARQRRVAREHNRISMYASLAAQCPRRTRDARAG